MLKKLSLNIDDDEVKMKNSVIDFIINCNFEDSLMVYSSWALLLGSNYYWIGNIRS